MGLLILGASGRLAGVLTLSLVIMLLTQDMELGGQVFRQCGEIPNPSSLFLESI